MPLPPLAKVTIDGLVVSPKAPFSTPRWVDCFGVTSPRVVWNLDPDAAAQVLAKREVAIRIEADNREPYDVKRAVVIGEQATGTPYARGVVLGDQRFFWEYRFLKRGYNTRVRTGGATAVAIGTGGGVSARQAVDEIAYGLASLKNLTTAWTAKEIVLDLLQALEGSAARDETSQGAPAQFRPSDVFIQGPGHVALAQALALLGAVDVRVDPPTGTVVLRDRRAGAERRIVEALMPYVVEGLGRMVLIRNQNRIPSVLSVRYVREPEVRADYVEDAGTTARPANPTDPQLQCVVQIAGDTSLIVTDPWTGRTGNEAQGTFVEVNAYLASIAARVPVATPDANPGALTLQRVQELYLGSNQYLLYTMAGGLIPDAAWEARLSSVFGGYRVTYLLNPAFASLVLPGSIRPVLSGLLSANTGQRQPSPVFMDYARRPSRRWLARSNGARFGWNVHALPPSGPQDVGPSKAYQDPIPLQQCVPAPAELQVLDSTRGVFLTAFRKDSFDQIAQTVPSLVRKLPIVDGFQVAAGAFPGVWDHAELCASHRTILLFSCVPAGPNGAGGTHRYDVSIAEALGRLGVPVGDQRALGPTLELFVGPALVTARFAWDDTQREAILSMFDPRRGGDPQALVPVNDGDLRDYAVSYAASVVAPILDHYEGTAGVGFEPALTPIGSMVAVTHSVDQEGRALTIVDAQPAVPLQPPEQLASDSTRRALALVIGN